MQTQGMIYVFTGDGKGKTSAGLGIAIRALASGHKVAIIQWYKDPSWRTSDTNIKSLLNPTAIKRFTLYPMGKGFNLKDKKTAPLTTGQIVIDTATQTQHHQSALKALELADSLINQVDVLILDEVNNALHDNLLQIEKIIYLLSKRGQTHMVLTGRNADPKIIALADLVTDMTKIKHPYDQGKSAIKGLDF